MFACLIDDGKKKRYETRSYTNPIYMYISHEKKTVREIIHA
jgi:hypothetical protein